MAKKEGYRHYELEPGVVVMIGKQKKEKGMSKDFMVNKSIEYFFSNRLEPVEGEKYQYEFNPMDRGSVYIYLQRKNYDLLEAEEELTGKAFNCIINEAVKFYLKNHV